LRVRDDAAGKRVKCPKCGTLVRVPAGGPELEEPATPESTAVSSSPLPPSPPTESEPQAPELPEAPLEADADAFSTKPIISEPRPPEDEPPSRRSRGYGDDDDDDDDDDLDVRTFRRQPVNGMALASMIVGIISVAVIAISCACCGAYGPIIGGPISGICAIVAILLGFLSKKQPGSGGGYATAGIICGFCALGLIVVMIILIVFVGGVFVLLEMQKPPAQRFN
jgi:hypothetical protein